MGTDVFRVWIPDSVKEIDDAVFFNCQMLWTVRFPEKVHLKSTLSFRTDDKPSEGQMTAMFGLCRRLSSITSGNERITPGKASIPSAVTKLGRGAFLGCEELVSAALPDGLTAIDSQAFDSAFKLKSINIPKTVTYIDGSLFARCRSLDAIQVDRLNPKFSSQTAGVITSKNGLKLVAVSGYYYGVVPRTVKAIGDRSLVASDGILNSDPLRGYTLPDNIEIIGSEAFRETQIGSFTVRNASRLASIGTAAFWGVPLSSFRLPTIMKPKLFSWTAFDDSRTEKGLRLDSPKAAMLAYDADVEMFFPIARSMVYDQKNVPNQRYANNAFFKLEKNERNGMQIKDYDGNIQTYDSYKIYLLKNPNSAVLVGSYWIKRQTGQWWSVGSISSWNCAILPLEYGEYPNVFGCVGHNGGVELFPVLCDEMRFGIYSHDPKAPGWINDSLHKCEPAILNKVSIGLYYPEEY
jgi:hypothetical protein